MEWWISRWCEEFHCLPDAALAAWWDTPSGLMEQILEYRGYARARQQYEAAQHWEDGPAKRKVMADPLVALVKEIEFDLVRQRRGRPIGD